MMAVATTPAAATVAAGGSPVVRRQHVEQRLRHCTARRCVVRCNRDIHVIGQNRGGGEEEGGGLVQKLSTW